MSEQKRHAELVSASMKRSRNEFGMTSSLKLRRKDGNIREYLQPCVIEEAFERGIASLLG